MIKCTAPTCAQGKTTEEDADGQIQTYTCLRCEGTGIEADHIRCCTCNGILRADAPIGDVQQHSGREECPRCWGKRADAG
jgi:hypothetical protein